MASPTPEPESTAITNALSVDVEDYFQVSAFEAVVPRSDWPKWPSRVERNTRELMDLFDVHGAKGTFFTLGWVAERFPGLVREIAARGHEVASHGYEHRLVSGMTPEEFRADIRRAGDALSGACGQPMRGFRAPSFSFTPATLWAYEILADEGYAYSSSVFPVRHDRYGIPSFPRNPVRLVLGNGREITEFPMTTLRLLGKNVPVAGGGWLRALPPALLRRALRSENAASRPGILYLHPWEIDPEQPRIDGPRMARLRHYLNLSGTQERLAELLAGFPFDRVDRTLAGLRAPLPQSMPLAGLAAALSGAA